MTWYCPALTRFRSLLSLFSYNPIVKVASVKTYFSLLGCLHKFVSYFILDILLDLPGGNSITFQQSSLLITSYMQVGIGLESKHTSRASSRLNLFFGCVVD